MEKITAWDIINQGPPRQFPSRSSFVRYAKRLLARAGYTPFPARYDRAGDCLVCGEAGRCPGAHTQWEADHPAARHSPEYAQDK